MAFRLGLDAAPARVRTYDYGGLRYVGCVLILAAKDPLANTSLNWFTIWSSIVHGGIMLIHAVIDETDRVNLVGDVPALFLFAFVLWYLMPKQSQAK